jgi:hypothetical protein
MPCDERRRRRRTPARDLCQQRPHLGWLHRHSGVVQQSVELIELPLVLQIGHPCVPDRSGARDTAAPVTATAAIFKCMWPPKGLVPAR